MIDRDKLRQKILLGLIISPTTFLPIVAGITGLLVTLLGFNPIVLFGSLCCLLVGVGTFITRLTTGSKKISERALKELEAEARAEKNRQLDLLDRQLSVDNDDRDNQLLADLRTLIDTFESAKWGQSIDAYSRAEIIRQVSELFDGCIRELRQALHLWSQAQKLSKRASKPILDQRENVLEDVRKSVDQLSRISAQLQAPAQSESVQSGNLARIRNELDQSLQIAREADRRIRAASGERDITND